MMSWPCGRTSMGNTRSNRLPSVPGSVLPVVPVPVPVQLQFQDVVPVTVDGVPVVQRLVVGGVVAVNVPPLLVPQTPVVSDEVNATAVIVILSRWMSLPYPLTPSIIK